MSQPLLNAHPGQQEYVDHDPKVARLEADVRELKHKLDLARIEADHAKGEAVRAVSALRGQLSGLYGAMKILFGEMDSIAPDGAGAGPQQELRNPKREVWELWKQKMGEQCSRIIDALLDHGTMTRSQLIIATRISSGNIAKPISRLYTANLINKNGDGISLKQI